MDTENNKITEPEDQIFRQKYIQELERNRILESRLRAVENGIADYSRGVSEIKSTAAFKLAAPIRGAFHKLEGLRSRVGNYGSIRGILAKVRSKQLEIAARKSHGTASFPDENERKRQQEAVFEKRVVISILVPLYNTPKQFLREMIDSVMNQTYGGWELCLADGSDAEHAYVGEYCRELAAKEPRIKYEKLEENKGISGNTNRCLMLATGEYIGLFDHDDILHPSVLYEYMKVIDAQGADYIYCDECTFSGSSIDHMETLHFKPDFSIDNLRANNYICHFSVFKRELLEGDDLFRSIYDGAQDHDMILRLTSRAEKIVHVQKLMYYWRSHAGSTAKNINAKTYAIDAARGCVEEHLRVSGFRDFQVLPTKAFETIFRVKYSIVGDPKISVIIPNRDQPEVLKRCISSILEKSTYENYEIIILENSSENPETFEYYDSISKRDNVRVLTWEPGEEGFNYSAINNYGVSESTGDYICLLNNDTEVISIGWMEELLMYAQRPDVAAAGAKLYYPDRTIQHAGVVIGLGAHRTAGHSHYNCASTNLGYMGRLCYAQDLTAVTGACLMCSREKWDEVGGLDESFAVSLNDVDLCLKFREKGYLNVWNPYCELYHYESRSRGSDLHGANAERYDRESAMFREKWKDALEKGDPFYNRNFSLDRSDFTIIPNIKTG